MGIEEYTRYDEHWVIYGSGESLYYTPETNIALYINRNLHINLKKIKINVTVSRAFPTKHFINPSQV